MAMEQASLFATPSLSVSDITRYLRQVLESDPILTAVWVTGEVSNLSRPSSGHIYFTLKDSGAALKCVMWRSSAQRLRFDLQNGLAVEAHGAVSLYERDGIYQLYVDSLRPAGVAILIDAAHQCMTTRGVHHRHVSTIPTQITGVFKTDATLRQRFLDFVNKR